MQRPDSRRTSKQHPRTSESTIPKGEPNGHPTGCLSGLCGCPSGLLAVRAPQGTLTRICHKNLNDHLIASTGSGSPVCPRSGPHRRDKDPHRRTIRTPAMGQRWPKAVTKRAFTMLRSSPKRASSGRGKDRILRLWQHLWIVQRVVQTPRFLAFHG